jgi:steroid delta-isomerase-like uncharacterized protein
LSAAAGFGNGRTRCYRAAESRLPEIRMRQLLTAIALLALPAAAVAQDCAATTEAENVAIARIWHEEVINNRNPAALEGILGETVTHHAAGGYPDGMEPAEVAAMMDDFLAAFPDLGIVFDDFIAEDDMVVERYTASGTQSGPLGDLPPSGRSATWSGINVFRIDCGRIVEVWSEVDALARTRQLAGDMP